MEKITLGILVAKIEQDGTRREVRIVMQKEYSLPKEGPYTRQLRENFPALYRLVEDQWRGESCEARPYRGF